LAVEGAMMLMLLDGVEIVEVVNATRWMEVWCNVVRLDGQSGRTR
jgi:hypothetical protein